MDVEPYVIDVLMPDLVGHDRQPSAFLTYLFLYRHRRDGGVAFSLTDIAEGTGLSRRAIQTALTRLETRRLVSVHRPSITSVGRYTVARPWNRGRSGDPLNSNPG